MRFRVSHQRRSLLRFASSWRSPPNTRFLPLPQLGAVHQISPQTAMTRPGERHQCLDLRGNCGIGAVKGVAIVEGEDRAGSFETHRPEKAGDPRITAQYRKEGTATVPDQFGMRLQIAVG